MYAEENAAGPQPRIIDSDEIEIGKTVLFDLAKLPEWLASREIQPVRTQTR